MDSEPLVKEQIDAGANFLIEFEKSAKYAPVAVAFWLRESERRRGHLYVVSEKITDENFDDAYREVGRVLDEMPPDPDFDPVNSVKVLGTHEPLAKAALDLRQRYPVPKPIRLRDTYIGGVSVAEIYIYPQPIPAPV